MNNYGGPISESQFNDACQNFYWNYALLNNNLTNLPLNCPCNDFINTLGINAGWSGVNNAGILLEYLTDQITPGQTKFNFSIVKATIDNQGTVTPEVGAMYFSISDGGIYLYDTPQKQTDRLQWKANFANVNLRTMGQINTPTQTTVGALNDHPTQVFFTCSTVWQMLNDNGAFNNNLTLVLNNVALYTPISQANVNNEYKCATPVFYLQNGEPMLTDEYNNFNQFFSNKGLGLGAHCPPDC